ncbi:MAG: phage terminase large subunit family protein [Bacteroidales bacterium]|nr:phage terminase large subunit family protein [Bacteroidales bacterium]
MSNHCIDVTCPLCGEEYDARLHYYRCPACGFNREKVSLYRQGKLPPLHPERGRTSAKPRFFEKLNVFEGSLF